MHRYTTVPKYWYSFKFNSDSNIWDRVVYRRAGSEMRRWNVMVYRWPGSQAHRQPLSIIYANWITSHNCNVSISSTWSASREQTLIRNITKKHRKKPKKPKKPKTSARNIAKTSKKNKKTKKTKVFYTLGSSCVHWGVPFKEIPIVCKNFGFFGFFGFFQCFCNVSSKCLWFFLVFLVFSMFLVCFWSLSFVFLFFFSFP